VLTEVDDWQGHDPEVLNTVFEHVARLREQGVDFIDD
jgi:rifampin ADP-ribosylating transferase